MVMHNQWGGRLEAGSEGQGKGACFTLLIPVNVEATAEDLEANAA